jgi:dihydropyrimidinase
MARRKLLIRGGTLITAETRFSDDLPATDVLVDGETIQAIGIDLPLPDSESVEVVDAGGLLILPGLIDAHTHIQLNTGIYSTADDWLEGSRAAAFGGITTVVDFATQLPGQSFRGALEARLAEAAPSVIDYTFHMMVTDLPPGQEEELGVLPELGIQSIKLYTTYRPNYYLDDAALVRILEAAARYGLISLVHCENDALVAAQTDSLVSSGRIQWRHHGASRPHLAEVEATSRLLMLAQAMDAPVVIAHASTERTVALVAQARATGQIAFVETTPQYLLLDNSLYEGNEPWRYILQPPLRQPSEKDALWTRVADGQVNMIVTDHCDYRKAQKLAVNNFTKTPGGLPGTETLLSLMATYGVAEGWIDWSDLVRMLATNPARIYNLWPQKGTIAPGSDADLVLFDPAGESVVTAEALHMVAGYSPFEGMRVKGKIVSTLRRGAFVVRDGAWAAEAGTGAFVAREPRFWD